MKNNRLMILGMLSLCVVDPIVSAESPQPNNNAGIIGGVIGLVAGLVFGIGGTAYHYTSEATQKEKEEEEKKLVKAAAAALDHIKKQAHSVLKKEGRLALEDVAILEGAELIKVEEQVNDFLTNVREHKSHLNKVTGRYSKDDKNPDYYQEAHTVFTEMGYCESLLAHCKNLLEKVNNLREKPLRNVRYILPLVNKLKSYNQTNLSTWLMWVEREYSASTTKDGIKGLPFVCAVEHIGTRHKELNEIIYNLELYQGSLPKVDQVVNAKLKKLYEDQQILQESEQLLASTKAYEEQIKKNEIALNERSRVMAELNAAEAERAKKEAELREAQNKARALENERQRNAIAAQQAATNLVNSVGSAVSSVAQHASDEALDKACREVARLERENSKLRARVKELEGQLRQYNMPQPSAPPAYMAQNAQAEGNCWMHGVPSHRCPNTDCKQ